MGINFNDAERPLLNTSVALRSFIETARDIFAIKFQGEQQSFDAPSWNVSKWIANRAMHQTVTLYFTRCDMRDQPLPSVFANAMKSYFVFNWQSPGTMQIKSLVARILWEAVLMRRGGQADIFRWEDLCEEDLSQTELMLRERYCQGTARRHMLMILTIINFLSARKICRPLYYVPQTQPIEEFYRRTIEGQELRRAKLPSTEAIKGLAAVYSTFAKDKPDRLLIDCIAILVVTGFRVGELLTLPVDCEVTEVQKGQTVYGIRYFKEKARGREKKYAVRWLTPLGAELTRQAIAEIRDITEAVRTRAKILEQNPDRVPVPGFDWNDRMYRNDLARTLGIKPKCVWHIRRTQLPCFKDERGRYYAYAFDVSAYLLSQRVDVLWTLDLKDGTQQKLSETLLIVPRSFFDGTLEPHPVLVEPLSYGHIQKFLAGGKKRQPSVFERFGIRENDGSYCHVTSHMFRHWLNDLADRGGLPMESLARWMGRDNLRDNDAYRHAPMDQRRKWVKEGIISGEIGGLAADIYMSVPICEREDYLEGLVQSVHITPMGLCIHDFALIPCKYHLNCLRGCPEYLRTKGSQVERTFLIQIQKRTEKTLQAAKEVDQNGNSATAQAWIQNCEETLEGANASLAIDGDSSIQDGMLVTPFRGRPSRYQPLSD
jgi:hypothetical protein